MNDVMFVYVTRFVSIVYVDVVVFDLECMRIEGESDLFLL